ncbi:MAG: DUF1254 domain-containing protein [Thermoleophilia bacterium]|nr:DUF1254 domain-containing protein [Thermoleophilia bacterium]MDH5281115.1 DUF1254 domain-containing protein [Thermoleophilia bacterium]
MAIKKVYDAAGLGAWLHFRVPTPIGNQPVIRMNRDTLYSAVVLDLSQPATVVLPDTGGRYQSLQVINQDHYSFSKIEPGRYDLTAEAVGSRYAYLIVRTFIDADDSDDVEAANAVQDALAVEGGGSGPLEIPDRNIEQLATARDALNTLAKWGSVTSGRSDRKKRPIRSPTWCSRQRGGVGCRWPTPTPTSARSRGTTARHMS